LTTYRKNTKPTKKKSFVICANCNFINISLIH
jgi:hypothetical protein